MQHSEKMQKLIELVRLNPGVSLAFLAKITLSGFRILRKTIFSVNGRNLSDQKLSGNFYGVSKRGSSMRSLWDTPP